MPKDASEDDCIRNRELRLSFHFYKGFTRADEKKPLRIGEGS